MVERVGYRMRGRTYRLYPTPEQAERLGQWVGAVRFVYNLALEQRRAFWRPGRFFNFVNQGREVTALRTATDWLLDAPRVTYDAALRDLDAAYSAWRAGRAGAPTMRRRGINDSFRLRQVDASFRRITKGRAYLKLRKMGDVLAAWDAPPPGEPRSVTVFRRAGLWFVSILYREERDAPAASTASAVGIDRGVAVFAALSTGELIVGPNVGRRAGASLARAQRKLARKVKGSSNYRKQRLRVARLHARVSAARNDFLHKTSTTIANNHGLVVLEDLKVRNMTASAAGTIEAPGRNVRQKAGLNRAILDQGWGAFKTMLAYKLEERGGYLLTVDPRNTSRTCSACGVVDADSREGVRFSCRSCDHEAHADTNAAINILRRGTSDLPVEAASVAVETGTSRGLNATANPQGWMPVTEVGRFNSAGPTAPA